MNCDANAVANDHENSKFLNHEKYFHLKIMKPCKNEQFLWGNVRKIFGQEAKLHGLLLSSSLLNVKLQATIKLSFNRVTFPKAHSSLVSFSFCRYVSHFPQTRSFICYLYEKCT